MLQTIKYSLSFNANQSMSLLIIHMICNEKYIRVDAIIIT